MHGEGFLILQEMRILKSFKGFKGISRYRKMPIVSERNYVNEEKQDGLMWMAWSCVDVARDDLETPDTCTKDCPGCVSRGRPLRRSSQNQEKRRGCGS